MFELKKIDVWSLVKITFILSFVIGLVFGFFYLLMMLFVSQVSTSLLGEFETDAIQIGGVVGIFLVFFIAIFTSLFYTIITAIMAILYNWVSGFTGGVRINLQLEEVEQSSQQDA